MPKGIEATAAGVVVTARAALAAVVLGVAALAGVGSGCERLPRSTESDPLAALRSAAESPSFGLAFWAQQERQQTRVWQEAAAFCRGRAESRFPNCGVVRMAGWWGNPPPLPALLPPPAGPVPAAQPAPTRASATHPALPIGHGERR